MAKKGKGKSKEETTSANKLVVQTEGLPAPPQGNRLKLIGAVVAYVAWFVFLIYIAILVTS